MRRLVSAISASFFFYPIHSLAGPVFRIFTNLPVATVSAYVSLSFASSRSKVIIQRSSTTTMLWDRVVRDTTTRTLRSPTFEHIQQPLRRSLRLQALAPVLSLSPKALRQPVSILKIHPPLPTAIVQRHQDRNPVVLLRRLLLEYTPLTFTLLLFIWSLSTSLSFEFFPLHLIEFSLDRTMWDYVLNRSCCML